jgi:fibronectin-binding autotransporter adhesin
MKRSSIPASSLATLLLLTALPQAVHAASGTWNVDDNGLWSLNTNWLTSIIADNAAANFTNNITADRTVSLDSARTITSLVFGDSNTSTAGSWILDNNGNAANTLTGLSTITVNALGTGKTATISAVIAGSTSRIELNGAGGGTLVLAGANTFNFTTNNANFGWKLNAGSTVVVASDSAFGVTTGTDFNATTLINLSGGTLQASGSARTVANPLWLNASTTVVSGSQSLTFSGAAMGRGGSATVTNNITGGGTLSFTGNVYTDNLGLSKILTFNGTGNTLISGKISDNTAGTNTAGAITKSGAGTLTLSNTASTYTGVTTISAGVMEAAALANGGTASSIGQSSNAATNLVFGAPTATLRYNGSSDATTDRGFTLSSGTGGGATVESSGSGTLTIDNTVALAYGTTGQTRLLTLGGTNTGANTFSKVIANNGSGATSLTKADTGTWSLTGTNTYTGNTTVSAGTLTLGSAGTLKFIPTDNGVCNKITGAGTATLNGTFDIDLTNAAIANGNSWTLVDTTTKNGTLSAVTGFTGSSGVWSKVDGSNTWTYTESTGVLGLVVGGSTNTYNDWATANGVTGGVNGDSNNDGVQNGIAYFMNATGQATLPGIIGNTVTWTNGGNIESSAYGTQFVVETSTDLATWTPVAGSDPNLSNTAGSVSYTLTSGLNKKFVRLVVTPN